MNVSEARTKTRSWHFRPLQAASAGFAAGLLLTALDALRMKPRSPEDFDALAVLLGRLVPAAVVAGLALALLGPLVEILRRLVSGLGRRRDAAVALVLTLALLPASLFLSRRLLAGAGISGHANIDVLRLLGPFVLSFGLLLFLRLGLIIETGLRDRPPVRSVFVALLCFVVALCAEWADSHLYLRLYPELHGLAFIWTALFLYFAFAILLSLRALGRLGLSIVAVLTLAVFAHAWFVETSSHSRYLLIRKTLQGPRVVALWKHLQPRRMDFRATIVADADFAARRRDAKRQEEALRVELERELGGMRPRHLVWITVDTLRRDSVGFMGNPRSLSPNLDALAERSLVFTRHQAQFPITSFSFQSAFYSRYPSATPLFRRINQQTEIEGSSRSLAEELGQAGFRTVSIPAIAARSLDNPAYEALATGFQELSPGAAENRPHEAPYQAAIAESVLESMDDRRLFLWLHFMDPHAPYEPHGELEFGSGKRDRYDSEIAFVDAAIGRLLRRLDDLGLTQDTMIVFNSDHGEAFGEHDTTFHGTTLYEEQIAVPAFIHLPGGAAGRIDLPTGNIDLKPTIHDLLGVPSAALMQGQSLAGYFIEGLDEQLLPLPFSFAEIPDAIPAMAPANRDRQSFVTGQYKLIANGYDDFVELYDLEADPGESKNLASRKPEIVARMLGMIRVIRQESEFIAVPETERSDEAYYEALRESLSAGPIPTRCRQLEEEFEKPQEALRPILIERLDDPQEHELIKLLILRKGRALLGERYADDLLALLQTARALGTRASLLDLWRQADLPLSAEVQGWMATQLLAHPQIAWRVARILAEHGDQRARSLLEPAMNLADFDLSFGSACGLGLLGDTAALPALERGLVRVSRDPERFEEALEAFGKLESDAAFLPTLRLLRDRYLHHRLKVAALRYFEGLSGELPLAGFVQLLNGWDPDVGRRVREVLDARIGAERAARVVAAGLAREELLELTGLGRLDEAARRCRAIIDDLETVEASFYFRLLEARLLLALDRGEDARSGLEAVIASALPEALKRAARSIRDQGVSASHELELLALDPVIEGPVLGGREIYLLARLRNAGGAFVPGGGDGATPIFRVITASGEATGQDFVSALPAPGLVPGEEIEFLVRFSVPEQQDSYLLDLRPHRQDGGPVRIVDRREEARAMSIASPEAPGLDPRLLEFSGEEILRGWLTTPAYHPGALMPDGSAAYLASDLDPILMSPHLAAQGRPLEITVTFRAEAGIEGQKSQLEFFWRFPDQIHFLPQQCTRREIALDGETISATFRVEPRDGQGPRQLRFDFFQEPELVEIESIRIRSLD